MQKPLVSFRIRLRPRRTVLPLRARVMTLAPGAAEGLRFAAHHDDVLPRQLAAVHDIAAQVALAFAGLVTVQVLLAGLAALHLARRGDAEALFRGLVGLHFWHGRTVRSREKRTGPSARGRRS